MWKCMGLYTIMILLFLQHHVAVSSQSLAATHLTPSMQKLALFQFKLSLTGPALQASGRRHPSQQHPLPTFSTPVPRIAISRSGTLEVLGKNQF